MGRLSPYLLKGGPARSLCRPTRVGQSDGPFRYRPFNLKPIEKNYPDVLCVGNSTKLVKTAHTLIDFPERKHSDTFIPIYKERIHASVHTLHTASMAQIARAIRDFPKDSELLSIYEKMALYITHKKMKFQAKDLVDIAGSFCKHITAPQFDLFYTHLNNQMPNHLYHFTLQDIIALLKSFKEANFVNPISCKIFEKKLVDNVHSLDTTELAELSLTLGEYGYYSPNISDKITENALENYFSEGDFLKLLKGYVLLNLDFQKILLSNKILIEKISSHPSSTHALELRIILENQGLLSEFPNLF